MFGAYTLNLVTMDGPVDSIINEGTVFGLDVGHQKLDVVPSYKFVLPSCVPVLIQSDEYDNVDITFDTYSCADTIDGKV